MYSLRVGIGQRPFAHPTAGGDFRVTIPPEKGSTTRNRRRRGGDWHGFRVARGYPPVAGDGPQICRSRIDPDRDAQHGGPRAQAGNQGHAGGQGARIGPLAARYAGRVRRPGPEPLGAGGGVGGDFALDRAAQSRRRRVRSIAAPDPAAAAGEDEGALPPSAAARREVRRLRPDRARRRQRSRAHAHARRSGRATTMSSTATSASSRTPRAPIFCSWWRRPIPRKARAAA